MRCGCPVCGTYMIQQEQGIKSKCVCPACAHICDACMGTEQAPLSREQLEQQYNCANDLIAFGRN